jgi:hypothetical protein
MLKFKTIGEDAVDDIDSAGELNSVSNALKLTLEPHSVNKPRSTTAIKLMQNRQNHVNTFNQILLMGLHPVNQDIIKTINGITAMYAVADASIRKP